EHPAEHCACAEEGPGRVDVEVALPVGELGPGERGGGRDAGVVDEYVDRPEPLEERDDLSLVGHVADLVDRRPRRAPDRDDAVARAAEPLAAREADPLPAAGDDDRPHCASVITMFRYSSMRAVWPGGTTSVVIGVQTIAGPGTAWPGRRSSKS